MKNSLPLYTPVLVYKSEVDQFHGHVKLGYIGFSMGKCVNTGTLKKLSSM